jgi:type VI secretion system protein VasJ
MDIIKLGRSKISKEKPEGEDVRYETVFDELQNEIDKLSSPEEINSFDWKIVSEKAEDILKNHSKDLLVASYYCVSILYIEGIDGLKIGSKIYSEIISVYWETLFPVKKRMRGRISAIDWWIEKTNEYLESSNIAIVDKNISEEINKNILTMENFLKDKIEDKLELEILRKRITALTKEKVKAQTPKNSDSFQISSISEAKRGLSKVFNDLKKISKYLRDEDLANPQTYKFSRIAAWELVQTLPVDQDGITKISPPPEQQIDIMQKMRAREEWDKLLIYAETKILNPAYIFYLDLNRYVAESLINSGDRYIDAHDILISETLYFTNRLEGVENLCFTDGTPFADDDTIHWLSNSHGMPGKKDNNQEDSNETQQGKIQEELKNLKKLSRKKKSYIESVDILETSISKSASAKEAYFWRVGLAEIFIMRKETLLLYSQLEAIIQDIKKYDLLTWDPDAAITGLKIVYSVYRTKKTKEYVEKASEVLQMIARVKPAAALAL